MNITTSNNWVGLYSMTRTDFYIKESQLKLMEVPLNASTRFQCTGNDGEYSKVISFSVKGKFGNEQRLGDCPVGKRKTRKFDLHPLIRKIQNSMAQGNKSHNTYKRKGAKLFLSLFRSQINSEWSAILRKRLLECKFIRPSTTRICRRNWHLHL